MKPISLRNSTVDVHELSGDEHKPNKNIRSFIPNETPVAEAFSWYPGSILTYTSSSTRLLRKLIQLADSPVHPGGFF